MVDQDHDEYQDCPTPDAHEKLREATFFFRQAIRSVHEPAAFRYNLSAFLQAARSVDYFLLHHGTSHDAFDGWYRKLRSDFGARFPELARVIDARNLVVHERILSHHSQVRSGIFRGRRIKLTVESHLPLDISSTELLLRAQEAFVGRLLDEAHSAIGEQIGVERIWIVQELDEAKDVTLVAHRATRDLHVLLGEVHAFYGAVFEPANADQLRDPSEDDLNEVRVLLESDLDPSLPSKWNW